jgi:hypothetical protein
LSSFLNSIIEALRSSPFLALSSTFFSSLFCYLRQNYIVERTDIDCQLSTMNFEGKDENNPLNNRLSNAYSHAIGVRKFSKSRINTLILINSFHVSRMVNLKTGLTRLNISKSMKVVPLLWLVWRPAWVQLFEPAPVRGSRRVGLQVSRPLLLSLLFSSSEKGLLRNCCCSIFHGSGIPSCRPLRLADISVELTKNQRH